jgi:hypothetical protein
LNLRNRCDPVRFLLAVRALNSGTERDKLLMRFDRLRGDPLNNEHHSYGADHDLLSSKAIASDCVRRARDEGADAAECTARSQRVADSCSSEVSSRKLYRIDLTERVDRDRYELPINSLLIHDFNCSEYRSRDNNLTLVARYLQHANYQKCRSACAAHDWIASRLQLDEGMRAIPRARI